MLALLDTGNRTLFAERLEQDNLVTLENAVAIANYGRAPADAVESTEQVVAAREYAKRTTDSIVVNDLVAGALEISRAPSNSIDVGDEVLRVVDTHRRPQDALAASESLAVSMYDLDQRCVSDVEAVSDEALRATNTTRPCDDSVSATDLVATALFKLIECFASDTTANQDRCDIALEWARALSDNAICTSIATRTASYLCRVPLDLVAMLDLAAAAGIHERAATESVEALDSASASALRLLERSAADDLAVQDSLGLECDLGLALDAIVCGDGALRTAELARSATDATSIDDEVRTYTAALRIVGDVLDAGDAVAASAWSIEGAAEDSVEVQDSLGLDRDVVLAEAIACTDGATCAIVATRIASDAAEASDILHCATQYHRHSDDLLSVGLVECSAVDNIAVADECLREQHLSRHPTDSLAIAELLDVRLYHEDARAVLELGADAVQLLVIGTDATQIVEIVGVTESLICLDNY
jgi:hypothetical protein